MALAAASTALAYNMAPGLRSTGGLAGLGQWGGAGAGWPGGWGGPAEFVTISESGRFSGQDGRGQRPAVGPIEPSKVNKPSNLEKVYSFSDPDEG